MSSFVQNISDTVKWVATPKIYSCTKLQMVNGITYL